VAEVAAAGGAHPYYFRSAAGGEVSQAALVVGNTRNQARSRILKGEEMVVASAMSFHPG